MVNYNFYSELNPDKRHLYDLMLETNYILLKCDEWIFPEKDEFNNPSISISWIHSLKPTLELFGLSNDAYPQGSLSANRNYYEALRNYFNGDFPINSDYNFFRNAFKNFLRLRRDNSSFKSSKLFGSTFKVLTTDTRDRKKYRSVEPNLRHSASALWILLEESDLDISPPLLESMEAFLNESSEYLLYKNEWSTDAFKHMTISSLINACKVFNNKFDHMPLNAKANDIIELGIITLVSNEILVEEMDGNYFWKLPNIEEHRIAEYEYYLNSFVLTQIPEIIENRKIQKLVDEMVKSEINSSNIRGVPINHFVKSNTIPDFGATVSLTYILWKIVNDKIGNERWINKCKNNFQRLLDDCLLIFNRPENYILPHSENNSKALLLPRFKTDKSRQDKIESIIVEIKKIISDEIKNPSKKIDKRLKNIEFPKGLSHVKEIISRWDIPSYHKINNNMNWDSDLLIKLGNIIGGTIYGIIFSV